MLRPRSLNRVYGISECQSVGANTERETEIETETETETDRSYRSSSDDDSEQGVYFNYKLKFCLEARTVYILQGSELTEQILVRI